MQMRVLMFFLKKAFQKHHGLVEMVIAWFIFMIRLCSADRPMVNVKMAMGLGIAFAD